MKVLVRVLGSSLGKKYIMAITGFILYTFVVFHMLGNLQTFLGQETVNRYAHFLKSLPEILWPARLTLLAVTIIHIIVAIQLTIENRRARGNLAYSEKKSLGATLASRTMAVSGLIVFAFIVYHLLHFTVGITNPSLYALKDSLGQHDVYNMLVYSFQIPYISIFYIVGVGLLCLHLSHGIESMFHSMGIIKNSYHLPLRWFARIFAFLIFIGMSCIPIAVLMGIIQPAT
ncbi:MAG: succinate dehydrogenase cytochrome b subunit [Verrucomicrobiae bacterium]|nr:succinate dehydrogenase cytochrome b subunit [Verrucomicrobiae bacterium]